MVFPLKETHHRIASIMISLHHATHQHSNCALREYSDITANFNLMSSAIYVIRALLNILLWANYGQLDCVALKQRRSHEHR